MPPSPNGKNKRWEAPPKGTSNSQPSFLKNDRYHEEFEQWRDHIKHEDGLINQRLTWLLVIQGFLFAAYGSLISSKERLLANMVTCSSEKKALGSIIDQAFLALPFLGVLSCLLLWWSIIAAQNVIHYIMHEIHDEADKKTLRLVGGQLS